MQTHVQAPASTTTEQTRQQQHQPEYETESAQLLRTPQFEDGRPEVTSLLHQQSLMANSPRATQLKAMQAMMANSPRVSQLQTTQAMMAASPRVQQLKTTQAVISAGTLAKQNQQASAVLVTQRMDDEEPLQSMAEEPVQREQAEASATDPTPQDASPTDSSKPNNTGLPDNLKTGIENLSGMSMDHVKVHYNSDKPAQLQAHAYAQGSEIHVAPGQEQHLPHEAWHVVQQAQGRVRPTVQMKGDIEKASVTATAHQLIQRRVVLDDASDFSSWDGEELDGGSEELEDLEEELKDDFDWNQHSIKEFADLIFSSALFTFRNFEHLNDFIGGNHSDAPKVENDEGAAMMMDDIAKDFGSSFKGKHVPFSGSRVYAVGRPGTVDDPDVWATQNSATGHITAKEQSVVKSWVADTPAKVLLDRLTFPSNTKRALDGANLGRPTVMASNAHAEVNQYVQLALLAATHGLNPEDLGLAMGSDIAHCAECYWALSALKAKGTGSFSTFTGCENKLFVRWREPWSGFYTSYGPNPFRKPDGSFKKNTLTKQDFAAGTYTADELNAVSPFKIYT